MHCLASGVKYIIYSSWRKTIQDVLAGRHQRGVTIASSTPSLNLIHFHMFHFLSRSITYLHFSMYCSVSRLTKAFGTKTQGNSL